MALNSGKLQRLFELEADNELLREDHKVLQQRFHRATEEAAKANASKESLERLVRVLEVKNGQPRDVISADTEETLQELSRTREALKSTEASLKQCTEERTQAMNRVRVLEGDMDARSSSTDNLVEDLELKLVEAQGELENMKLTNQSSERAKTKALRELEAAREYMVSQQRMMETAITEMQRDLNQARIEAEQAQLALQRTQSQQSHELQMHEQRIRGAREELAGVKLREQAALEQLTSHTKLPEPPEGLALAELKRLKSQVSALKRIHQSVRSDMQFFRSETSNLPQQMLQQMVTTIQHQASVKKATATDNLSNELAQAVSKMSAERDRASSDRDRVSQERDRALMMLQASIADARDACMESHMRGSALGILGRLIREHSTTNLLRAFMKWAHAPRMNATHNTQELNLVAATVVGWYRTSIARALSFWKGHLMQKMNYAAAVEKREIQLAEMFCEAEGKRERAEKGVKQLQKKIDAADKRTGSMQGAIDAAERARDASELREGNMHQRLQECQRDVERIQGVLDATEQREKKMSMKLQASLNNLQNTQELLAVAQQNATQSSSQQHNAAVGAEQTSKLREELATLQNAHTAAKASIAALTEQLQPTITSTSQLAATAQMQDMQHVSITNGQEALLAELSVLQIALGEVEKAQESQKKELTSQESVKPSTRVAMICDASDRMIIGDLQKELKLERNRCLLTHYLLTTHCIDCPTPTLLHSSICLSAHSSPHTPHYTLLTTHSSICLSTHSSLLTPRSASLLTPLHTLLTHTPHYTLLDLPLYSLLSTHSSICLSTHSSPHTPHYTLLNLLTLHSSGATRWSWSWSK